MPSLETPDGRPVDVTPVDADAVNAAFSAAMADDGPDEQAPPKRPPKTAEAEPKRRPRATKDEKARSSPKAASVALDDAQRANGVKGLVQIAAVVPLGLAKATGSDAYKADAITIAGNADQLADACVQTARADARFAAALDKVCSAGPYAALISVALGIGTQIARNHKPSLRLPGTVDPGELLKAAEAQHEPAAA